MILSDGDITQYNALRTATIHDYLIKLETWAAKIKAQQSNGNN